jgi:hypothetical protein
MKRVLIAGIVGFLLSASPVWAISVNAQVEGPLLGKERVLEYVQKTLTGAISEIPGLEQGGKYRLFVRIASKHIGTESWFLYFAEVQLQRRVKDAETSRLYWASLRSAVLWGTVPTENEVRDALESLMKDKVSQWTAE